MEMSLKSLVCVFGVFVCSGVHSSPLQWTTTSTGYNQCGVEASDNLIHHDPWLVDLEFRRGRGKSSLRCAATLIDSYHAITAAHCLKKSYGFTRVVVRLGEYNMDTKDDCLQGVCADPVVEIDAVPITHPLYDGETHDIAVLKLKREAPYTDFIRPICLPTGELKKDTIFTATGWGELPTKQGFFSSVKKIVPLPYWTRDQCVSVHKHLTVPKNVICAGGEKYIDTCNGDSGGPLTRIGKFIELWGVTSKGSRHCGTKNSPAFYTNVKDHMDWIHEIINTSIFEL